VRTSTFHRLSAVAQHAYGASLAIAVAIGLTVGVPTNSAKLGLVAGFVAFVVLRITRFPVGWIVISRWASLWRQIRKAL
jgi:hypothetical protein